MFIFDHAIVKTVISRNEQDSSIISEYSVSRNLIKMQILIFVSLCKLPSQTWNARKEGVISSINMSHLFEYCYKYIYGSQDNFALRYFIIYLPSIERYWHHNIVIAFDYKTCDITIGKLLVFIKHKQLCFQNLKVNYIDKMFKNMRWHVRRAVQNSDTSVRRRVLFCFLLRFKFVWIFQHRCIHTATHTCTLYMCS